MAMKKILKKIIHFIYPPICYICSKHIDNKGLCIDCYQSLVFVGSDICSSCGFSFYNYKDNSNPEINTNEGLKICLSCLHQPKIFSSFSYCFLYNEAIFKLVNQFKYLDNTNLKYYLVNFLQPKFIKQNFKDIDIVIPVPIFWLRMFKRKFNHSAYLAQLIADIYSFSYNPFILQKIKHTKPQMQLNGLSRLKNLKNTFSVNTKYNNLLKNKKILLIDDVVTTGSTIYECSKILKRAGAKEVHILVLARVEGVLSI
jgi:competence protein ComFC